MTFLDLISRRLEVVAGASCSHGPHVHDSGRLAQARLSIVCDSAEFSGLRCHVHRSVQAVGAELLWLVVAPAKEHETISISATVAYERHEALSLQGLVHDLAWRPGVRDAQIQYMRRRYSHGMRCWGPQV